jgi:restriction endonuclease S subunit
MKKNWIEVELGEVCGFVGGGTPSKSNPSFWNGNIPWASIKDVKGSFLNKTEDFITEEGLKNSASNLAFDGDIILATRINPGRPILSKIKTAINQDLKIVKPLVKFSPRFLFYLFKEIEPKVLKLSSGTTVLGINLTNLKSISIPLPPLPEQRAIVARIEELFSELDHSLTNLKSAQAKLEIYRQAVLKKAFQGGYTLNHGAFESEFWILRKLEEITVKITDGEHFRPLTQENGVYFLSAKDVRENGVDFSDPLFISEETAEKALKRCNPEKGDILIVSRGATVGRMCIVKTNEVFCLLGSVILLKIKPDINHFFLTYYLKSPSVNRKIISISGSTAQQAIYLRDIKKIELRIPPIKDQVQIVQEIESRLSVADKMAETIQTSIQKAEALRQSILKKAFEGKLLIEIELEACRNEADWEPAEKLLERIKSEKI